MRSGLIASLLTVGLALVASNKAEALTLTAADFACYQSGPCPIAGSEQNSRSQLWDWYQAVAAKDGGVGFSATGSQDVSLTQRYGDGGMLMSNDAGGREAALSANVGIIFVMGPAFNCLACFLETKDGGSAANLFTRGNWEGTDATELSRFYPGFDLPGRGRGHEGPAYPGGPTSPTPEPGTMGLVMVGLALLVGPVRRLLRERRS